MTSALLLALSALSAAPAPDQVHAPELQRGFAFYQELRYRDALRLVDHALATGTLTPSDALAALAVKGRIHAVLQEPAAAHEAFLELLRKDPGYQVGWDESPLITLAFQRALEIAREQNPAVTPPQTPLAPAPPPVALTTPMPAAEPARRWPWIVGITAGAVATTVLVVLLMRSDEDEPGNVDLVGTWQLP